MKLWPIAIVGLTHLIALGGGAAIGVYVATRVHRSPLNAMVAAGYSAENLELHLREGLPDDARVAGKQHLELLDRVRPEIGEIQYAAGRIRTLAKVAALEEASAHGAQAKRLLDEAVRECARARLRGCTADKLRLLAK
jgi:hypothetical protein